MKQIAYVLIPWLLAVGPAAAASIDIDQALAAQDYAAAYRASIGPAQAGDVDAMQVVATLIDTGKGVPQDFAAALFWYRRAAEAGSVRAMFNTAVMLDNGRGVEADRLEAIRWYARAAAHGDARAAYALGVIYRDGDGVPRDRVRAIEAFRKAAAGGLEAAKANLAALRAAPSAQPGSRAVESAAAPRRPAEASGVSRPDLDQIQNQIVARTPVDRAASAAFANSLPMLMEHSDRRSRMGLYDMGYAYQHGYGISKDLVKSYVYYLQAALSPEPSIKAAALRGATEVGAGLTEAEHRTAQAELLDAH